jgi:hypothetical protein
MKESLDAGRGLHVLERDSLQPSGGAVHYGEQVPEAVSRDRKRPN